MNRRQFTQSLIAAAATPAVPASALASAAAPAATLSQPPYCWAAFIARVHNKASPAMFKRQLGLSTEAAQNVFDTLLREQVITRPDAMGISQTVAPFKRSVDQMIRFKPSQPKPAPPSKPTHKNHPLLDDSNSFNQELAKEFDETETEHTPPAETALPEDPASADQLD